LTQRAIDLDFAGNKAVGTFTMNGQTQPISTDLGGPLFADAAGANHVIACLLIAEGFTTTFRNFNVHTKSVRLLQLAVAAPEKATVSAGTFDTYRIEITSAEVGSDKETLWISNASHKVVKETAAPAAMGGAALTEELVE
jgi:hypothetical protein